MKKRVSLVIILLVLALLFSQSHILSAEEKEFTFVVMGDNRPLNFNSPYPPAFSRMIDEINLIRPELVLHTGDIISGYDSTPQQIEIEYKRFNELIKKFQVPFYVAIGNHEMGFKGTSYFKKFIRQDIYTSFNRGNVHFILLDTGDETKDNVIDDKQFVWLEGDLEKHKNDLIFVFMHKPMYYTQNSPYFKQTENWHKNRDKVAKLFSLYKVHTVFAAHDHFFGDMGKQHGVRYIISAGAGAPFYRKPQDGGFLHYIIVKVKGKDVEYQVVTPYTFDAYKLNPYEYLIVNRTYEILNLKGISYEVPKGSYQVKVIPVMSKYDLNRRGKYIKVKLLKTIKEKNKNTVFVNVIIPPGSTLRVVLVPEKTKVKISSKKK